MSHGQYNWIHMEALCLYPEWRREAMRKNKEKNPMKHNYTLKHNTAQLQSLLQVESYHLVDKRQ